VTLFGMGRSLTVQVSPLAWAMCVPAARMSPTGVKRSLWTAAADLGQD